MTERLYRYTDDQGVRWNVPQDRLWQWLKAERQHHDSVKVAENQRRKLGVRLPEDFRPKMSRADRRRWRRWSRTWKRIK